MTSRCSWPTRGAPSPPDPSSGRLAAHPAQPLGPDPGGSSAYAQAVEALAPDGQRALDRGAVFSLPVSHGWRLRPRGYHHLAVMGESLSVYHSWDASIRGERGFGASDRFTWRQGLRRLRLGQVMDESALDEGAFAEVPPFRDLESGDREAVAAFDRTVEGLLRSVASWSREGLERPAAEWTATCCAFWTPTSPYARSAPGEGVVAAARRDCWRSPSIGRRRRGLSLVSDAHSSAWAQLWPPQDGPWGVTIARLAMPLCRRHPRCLPRGVQRARLGSVLGCRSTFAERAAATMIASSGRRTTSAPGPGGVPPRRDTLHQHPDAIFRRTNPF